MEGKTKKEIEKMLEPVVFVIENIDIKPGFNVDDLGKLMDHAGLETDTERFNYLISILVIINKKMNSVLLAQKVEEYNQYLYNILQNIFFGDITSLLSQDEKKSW